MARINIEEKWWNDPRRERLTEFLGNVHGTEAAAVKLWRLSQTYWSKGELIPGHIFIHTYGAKALLQSGLARVYEVQKIWVYPDPCEQYPNVPQRTPNEGHRPPNDTPTKWDSVRELEDLYPYFVYACGSREHHFWLVRSYLQRVEAGKKSAAKRKLAIGTAQPGPTGPKLGPNLVHGPADPRTTPQRNALSFEEFPERARTSVNGSEPSYSSSISSSCSPVEEDRSKVEANNPVISPKCSFDWDAVYALYPKRNGSQHVGKAIECLKAKIKTVEKYEDFKKAVINYAEHCVKNHKVGTEQVSQFKTFSGTLWEEWVNPVEVQPQLLPIQSGGNRNSTFAQQRTNNTMAAAAAYLNKQKGG